MVGWVGLTRATTPVTPRPPPTSLAGFEGPTAMRAELETVCEIPRACVAAPSPWAYGDEFTSAVVSLVIAAAGTALVLAWVWWSERWREAPASGLDSEQG